MENDILRPKSAVYDKADDVLVNKETGRYFLKGKLGSMFYIGQRKLTKEEAEDIV